MGLVLNVPDGILGNPDLQSDVCHPNAQGYEMMAARIIPKIQEYLRENQ